jgi:DNA polymerase-3 subunit epsilon
MSDGENLDHITRDRHDAIRQARDLLARDGWLILDTETTGLGSSAEIVELAIIDKAGNALFNRRFKPLGEIDPGASAVHGLTAEMLAGELSFAERYEKVTALLDVAELVIYNASFDMRMLAQTCKAHGLEPLTLRPDAVHCAMLHYAQFCGDWSEWHGNNKWQKLPGGDHTALGDARATLAVLQEMADAPLPGEPWPCSRCKKKFEKERLLPWAPEQTFEDRVKAGLEELWALRRQVEQLEAREVQTLARMDHLHGALLAGNEHIKDLERQRDELRYHLTTAEQDATHLYSVLKVLATDNGEFWITDDKLVCCYCMGEAPHKDTFEHADGCAVDVARRLLQEIADVTHYTRGRMVQERSEQMERALRDLVADPFAGLVPHDEDPKLGICGHCSKEDKTRVVVEHADGCPITRARALLEEAKGGNQP